MLIHPGASREIKRWPVENWARLADAIAERFGCSIAITGDRSEHSLAAHIAATLKARDRAQVLAGKISLPELARTQSRALAFLSGDTGPYHLAVAVGCPTVTLFAPTDRGSSLEACGPHQASAKLHRALQTEFYDDSIPDDFCGEGTGGSQRGDRGVAGPGCDRIMKIGIFLPNATFDLPGSPEVGGIETFSFTVGEALQRLGHEVILFGGAPKPGRSHRPTTLTLELNPYWETRAIPDLGTRFQRLIQRLHFAWSSRHAWARHRCDAVLLAKPFDWPVAWCWKRARPELKVIMGFHGTDFFSGDRRFYGAVDAAFAVSKRVADLAEKRVGQRPVLIPIRSTPTSFRLANRR